MKQFCVCSCFLFALLPLLSSLFTPQVQGSSNIVLDPAGIYPGYYDAEDNCFDNLNLKTRATPPTGFYDDPQLGFYFSKYEPLPKSTGFLPYAIALAPICVALNATSVLSSSTQQIKVELSLETIGAWMMGTLKDWNKTVSPSSSSYTGAPVGIGQMKLVLATDSKVNRAIMYRMNQNKIAGFGSPWAIPASVLANPNITFVANEAATIAALHNVDMSAGKILVGFVGVIRAGNFDCAAISVTSDSRDVPLVPSTFPSVDSERVQLAKDPYANADEVLDTANRRDFNFSILQIDGSPAYPLYAPLFLNTPITTVNCSDPNAIPRAMAGVTAIARIFGALVLKEQMYFWNLLPLSSQLTALIASEDLDWQDCIPIYSIRTGGSTSISSVMNRYAARYLVERAGNIDRIAQYMNFGNTGTTQKVGERYVLLGATENAMTPAKKAAWPQLRAFPAIAYGVAIIFNIDLIETLFLSRCDLVDLFNGTIKYWDDPRLQKWNPAVRMPHVEIQLTISLGDSGSSKIFLAGLRALDLKCNLEKTGVAFSNVVPSETWNLAVTKASNSTDDALTDFKATSFSLSFAVTPSIANDPSITEARLINTSDLTVSYSDAAVVQKALANARIIDKESGELDLTATATSADGFPFIGYSYFVAETNSLDMSLSERNCTSMRKALRFALWALTDVDAQSIAVAAGYVPFPDFIIQNGVEKLVDAKCNGLWLFPEQRVNTTQLDLTPIIGGAVGGFCALLVGFIATSIHLANRGKRSDKHAVKNGETPMALIFTDIQASTTLWSVAPQAMAASLDLHNEIIERNIEQYDGYKIKTIGDAFMICFKDVKKAHDMCLAIQRDLHYAEWPSEDIDIAYADVFQDEESPYQLFNPDGTEISNKQRKKINGYETELYKNRTNPQLFHGISIRIGMTWGCAEPKVDAVTNAYDYLGTNVCLASRCESCGNGGQTIYSIYAIDALRNAGVDLTDTQQLAVVALGKQALKGIPAPTELYQVLPAEFAARKFPPLRLDKDSALDIEMQDSDENNTHPTSSASATATFTNTTNSNKTSDRGTASSDPQNKSSASSAPTDDSLEDEAEKKFPMDYRFSRYLCKQARCDPRLVLFVYDACRAMLAANPNEKNRKTIIDNVAKDWRIQDNKTKHHLFFKKELGYEGYWFMRIALRIFGQISMAQRKRDAKNEHEINLVKRGMIQGNGVDQQTFGSTLTGEDGFNKNSTGGSNGPQLAIQNVTGNSSSDQRSSQATSGSNAAHNIGNRSAVSSFKYRSNNSDIDENTTNYSHNYVAAVENSAFNTDARSNTPSARPVPGSSGDAQTTFHQQQNQDAQLFGIVKLESLKSDAGTIQNIRDYLGTRKNLKKSPSM